MYEPTSHTSTPAYQIPDGEAAPLPPMTPPTRRRKVWPWFASAGLIVAAVLVGVTAFALATSETPIESARKACPDDAAYVRVGDGGKTLIMNGAGTNGAGASEATQICYIKALKVPDSVLSHIAGTRALDGRQTDTWGDMSAAWTYHPDAGLDITFTLK
jgi:hypothetical protein